MPGHKAKENLQLGLSVVTHPFRTWALQCMLATTAQKGWALLLSHSAGTDNVPHGRGSIPVSMQDVQGLGPACVWGGRWHFCYLFFNRSSLLLKAHSHHVPAQTSHAGERHGPVPSWQTGLCQTLLLWGARCQSCQQYQLWMGWYQGIYDYPKVCCHSVSQPAGTGLFPPRCEAAGWAVSWAPLLPTELSGVRLSGSFTANKFPDKGK